MNTVKNTLSTILHFACTGNKTVISVLYRYSRSLFNLLSEQYFVYNQFHFSPEFLRKFLSFWMKCLLKWNRNMYDYQMKKEVEQELVSITMVKLLLKLSRICPFKLY